MNDAPLIRMSYTDPDKGFEGMLVIDSLVDGICGGGLRVTSTVDMTEVTRLAAGMTLKNRVMGLPLGGAKSALRYDPRATDLEDALVRFFSHIRPMVEKMYGFGPDMNTPPDLCDAVARRVGLKSRHTALAESSEFGYDGVANYDKALRLVHGPLQVVDARTSVGVAAAVERAAEVYGLDRPLRFAVQGFGSVGMGTVYFLTQRDHVCVGVADAGGYYADPKGLDFKALHAAKGDAYEIDGEKLPSEQRAGSPGDVLFADCDVLVLAAIPDALRPEHLDKLKCKLIVEGGNFAVAPAALQPLHEKGIPVVPDIIASGGAIATVSGIIQLGWSIEPEELLGKIGGRVADATESTANYAREHNMTIREAAMETVAALPRS